MSEDYKALTGINFPHRDSGEDVRVEAGGKISSMGDDAVANELAAGNIEPWTEEQDEAVEQGGAPAEEEAQEPTGEVSPEQSGAPEDGKEGGETP